MNKKFAKVDTKPDPMFFIVKKGMNIKKGSKVELWQEESEIGYIKIIIT
jgi:hypothetical protein